MDTEGARAALLRLRDALGQGDRAKINLIAQQLIAARAPLGRQWNAIATVLQHNGEVSAADRKSVV